MISRSLCRAFARLACLLAATVVLSAAPPAPIPGGFTLVVLPDTQYYSLQFPEIYHAQTQFIADQAKSLNILQVAHVGDVTDKNTEPEWQVAAAAHQRLAGVVPCLVVPGNHDLDPQRNTGLSTHFPVPDRKAVPAFGGTYDREPQRTDNTYHTFSAGGRKWLLLGLEFGPRDDVVRWANEVVARHADHTVILITHAYLRNDGTRFDHREKAVVKGKEGNKGLTNYKLSGDPAGFHDGEDLWRKLVSQHANIAFVISGHTCIAARRTDTGVHGNPVHQLLVDYQNQPNGGNGYLRLLQFSPDAATVRVTDYSPTLDQVSPFEDSQFTLQVPPARKP